MKNVNKYIEMLTLIKQEIDESLKELNNCKFVKEIDLIESKDVYYIDQIEKLIKKYKEC